MSTSNRAVFSVDFELFTQTPAYRSATGETDEQDLGLAGLMRGSTWSPDNKTC